MNSLKQTSETFYYKSVFKLYKFLAPGKVFTVNGYTNGSVHFGVINRSNNSNYQNYHFIISTNSKHMVTYNPGPAVSHGLFYLISSMIGGDTKKVKFESLHHANLQIRVRFYFSKHW